MSRQRILDNLRGNRLPTTLQVLQRYEWIRKSNTNSETNEIIDLIIEEVLAIWNKAYIPTKYQEKVAEYFEKI